jgi:hypothetical protein
MTMGPLQYIGDALWIAALSIMCSAALQAWKRIPPDVTVPLQWASDGRITWRLRRRFALPAIPAFAFFVGVMLVLANRNVTVRPQDTLMLFGVRAVVPAVFAIMYLRWLKEAMKTLDQEGVLKP